MSYASLDELRSQLGAPQTSGLSDAYRAKMLHDLPSGAVVDRTLFLLQKVAGKRVLEFGASGPMSDGIRKAAAEYFGVDRADDPDRRVKGFDLDDVSKDHLPSWSLTDFVRLDVIVCGEVLEHLANPGHFLQRLRVQFAEHEQHAGISFIITVPNAFSAVAAKHVRAGRENVNVDHVAWYSPRTLKTLVERYGFTIREFAYYNGEGPTAEGLIAVVD